MKKLLSLIFLILIGTGLFFSHTFAATNDIILTNTNPETIEGTNVPNFMMKITITTASNIQDGTVLEIKLPSYLPDIAATQELNNNDGLLDYNTNSLGAGAVMSKTSNPRTLRITINNSSVAKNGNQPFIDGDDIIINFTSGFDGVGSMSTAIGSAAPVFTISGTVWGVAIQSTTPITVRKISAEVSTPANENNLKRDTKTWVSRASYANDAKSWFSSDFFWWSKTWEAWVEWLTTTIARDLKNVFIAIAIFYMFVLVLRLFFGQWSEDDLKKWRLGVLWTTMWVVLMQISFVAFTSVYDKAVWAWMAKDLTESVLLPIISLLEVVTSFLFIAMAIMAFYRIITSWWNDDWYKKWINTVINAVIWFLLIKISAALVKSIYWWEATCTWTIWAQTCSVSTNPNLTETTKIIASLIQYLTWFISIITLLLIVYAWFMILTSSWDDAKVKKWKSVIKYIVMWMILIASSVLIFHLITWKDFSWIIWKYK